MDGAVIRLERTVLGREITVTAQVLDDGIWAVVAGGDRSHVGAISWAEPGRAAETKIFPGHKDQFVSGPWAEALASHTGTRAAVACGIHYDGASREDIGGILRAAEELLQTLLRRLS